MPSRSRSPWLLLALAAFCSGVALRVFALREQVPCDDELVSIEASLAFPYSLLFGSFQPAYYSIPHALILRGIADVFGLDELTLRLPSLLAGIALLAAGPWFAWRRFGAAPAAVFAGLLALSPLLVFYSRLARAYAIATLLVWLALVALERWLAERRPRHAFACVGLGAAAIWFHQLAAPAIAAPLALAALLRAFDAPPGQRWRELYVPLWMALCIAVLVLALLWSALVVSLVPLVAKMGRSEIHDLTLLGAMALFAGTRELWLVGVVWLGAALGCALALRRHFRVAALLLASGLTQWLCVAWFSPWLSEVPRIFARYVVWSLPCFLLFLALAVAELARLRVAGRDWPVPALAGSLLLALLYRQGPLPLTDSTPNNFTAHSDFLEQSLAAPAVPEFYRRVRDEPGDFAIVEAPLRNSPQLMPYHLYQQVHGKRVRIGFLGRLIDPPNTDEFPLDDPRVAFRTFVDLADPAAVRAAGARYLVLHRDLGAERGFPALPFDLAPVIAEYERRLGPPLYADASLSVFALR